MNEDQGQSEITSAPVESVVTTLPIYGPRSHWFFMAACNYPETGKFARRSDQFRFNRGDHFIDVDGPSIVFDWYKNAGNKRRVKVSRWAFPCVGYIQWYGNWCWDATKITDEAMVEICCRLKQCDFSPVEATDEMWQWWESL